MADAGAVAETGTAAPGTVAPGAGPRIGAVVADLEITRAWLVDPVAGREGPGEVVITDGILEAVTWLEGAEAEGVRPDGVVVAPGFVDLHAHFREPGFEDAETVASGSAAAAHGGFTTVCVMPNTSPAIDDASVLARVLGAAAASGSPVEVLAYGTVTVGRAGEQLAALGELADGGAIGFSDDGSPVRDANLLRNALLYAGMLGLPIVDHPESPGLTAGAEANEGLVASVLGLKGWPAGAEIAAVERDIAVLADVLRDEPRARLHLTHLSTAGALDAVRRAKAAGLPVTCDVTPHHVALTDEWLAGARRWAWEAGGPKETGGTTAAVGAPEAGGTAAAGASNGPASNGPASNGSASNGSASNPWADGAIVARPYDTSLRVNPPLRAPADALACLAAIADGTADAVATDHAPHTLVDKEVEFGLAANGISGLETALGLLLAAVDAGRLTLPRAIAALTSGPAGVLAGWPGVAAPSGAAAREGGTRGAGDVIARARGLVEGTPADLVVFDRADRWAVSESALVSKGKNSPLLGRELTGRVLLTIAGGRLAYQDHAAEGE